MVEWDGLENRCGCKLTVGSNPTLSAKGHFQGVSPRLTKILNYKCLADASVAVRRLTSHLFLLKMGTKCGTLFHRKRRCDPKAS